MRKCILVSRILNNSLGDNLYLKKETFKEFLSDISRLKVRKMSHAQVKLMFEVLLYGGMRVGEVLQITPESLVNGKIRLERTKGGVKRCPCSRWSYRPTKLLSVDKNCPKCFGLGKFRIPVEAWLQEQVYQDLVKFAKTKQPGERLFPITRAWVWHWVDFLINGRTHTFRHTFLTWLIDSEKFTVRDIMQKARHKSLAVTTKYIESNNDVIQSKENKFIERV